MNILDIAIVSNSEMIKNYKDCRNKAENLSKIFILKNNEPDAVLFSINNYKKLSAFFEYLDNVGDADLLELHNCLPKSGNNEMSKLKQLITDLQENEKAMAASFLIAWHETWSGLQTPSKSSTTRKSRWTSWRANG